MPRAPPVTMATLTWNLISRLPVTLPPQSLGSVLILSRGRGQFRLLARALI
jgi:hypothetical protein